MQGTGNRGRTRHEARSIVNSHDDHTAVKRCTPPSLVAASFKRRRFRKKLLACVGDVSSSDNKTTSFVLANTTKVDKQKTVLGMGSGFTAAIASDFMFSILVTDQIN